MGSAVYSQDNCGPVELLPNPHFVFPALPSSDNTQLSSWTSLNQRRRPDSTLSLGSTQPPVGRTRHTASLLPNFTFNPAGSGQASPSTPPHSPSFNGQSTPSRTARHRRGGSEFIGMDHKTGNVSVISSSPVKIDPAQLQAPLHLGPPPGRRHAHRRSGAISCHDLSSILQPKDGNIQTKSESAPTSPLDIENRQIFPFPQDLDSTIMALEPEEPKSEEQSPQKRPPSRARVGFSEKVEYIRPLSIISSETESSMSTIRGHSVSGSFSSMMSSDITSSSPHRMVKPVLQPTTETEDQVTNQRPQTASEPAQSPRLSYSFPTFAQTTDRPSTASCISDARLESRPKKKHFTWWDTKNMRSSSAEATKDSASATNTETSLSTSPPDSPSFTRKSLESDQETLRCNTSNEALRKPRKVRSWAHSLISRKNKSKKDYPRPPTPPASHDVGSDTDETSSTASLAEVDRAGFEVNFDEDNTVTIITEPSGDRPSPTGLPKLFTDVTRAESEVLSPVIDLDAALGPFNTPPLASNARDLSGRHPPRPRRSMHSLNSAGMALTLGPSHRRTESAPELVPFELRAKLPHTVMPDVFEEEDEEDLDDKTSQPESPVDEKEESVDGMGVHVVEIDESAVQAEQLPPTPGFGPSRRKKSEGLVISTDSTPRHSSAQSPRAVRAAFHQRDGSSIDVVEDHEEPRDSKTSDDTITPPHTGGKDVDVPVAFRFPLPLPPHHVMTPDTLSDMSGSPFFSPSQASLETPRLGTGTSSINETTPIVFTEPGPEIRMSVDDVPSLTSSRSTMTSPLVNHTSMAPPPPPSSSGRAASVYSIRSSATAEIRAKRSSIASISRFVTGSFSSEKSKLSIEARPMSQHTTLEYLSKKPKQRSHRLSKLMQFWKSKERKVVETN
jgi:hypothetical protein